MLTKRRKIFWQTRTKEYSKALHYGARFGKESPPEVVADLNNYMIAERFGWTIEYVESLDPFTYHQVLGYIDGKTKTQKWINESRR